MHPGPRTAVVAVARGLALPLALAGLVTLLVTAFAWPASHAGPREVPVAVSGTPAFVEQIMHVLTSAGPGAFDLTVAPTSASGEQMLRRNEVDGLFEQVGTAPHLDLASAGRPAVAQLLSQVETEMLTGGGTPAVSETVAGPADDPRSAVFTAATLPSMLGAIAVGVILALIGGTRRTRLLRLAVVSLGSGTALMLVMDEGFGALGGDRWALAGIYALAIGAVTSVIGGLHNLFGRHGMGTAAATVMLLGNPLSGATSAPDLLPDGWSALGQALPPGALTSALRTVAFYDGNGAAAPVFILAAWVVVGLLLHCAGPAAQIRWGDLPAIVTKAVPLEVTADHLVTVNGSIPAATATSR